MEHDTSNYRLSTPHGCVAQLCALCRDPIALDPGVYTAAQIDQRIADHKAVCWKRPIAVGDYVRWESGLTPARWVEGELMDIPSPDKYGIRVADKSDWEPKWPDERGWHMFNTKRGAIIRRIPRPEAAHTTPTAERRVFPRGADRSRPCGTCARYWGDHYGVACEQPYMAGYESGPVCAPGCPCGAHATALVDGLDREACLARWMENRLFSEGVTAPPNAMTRMQRDVGRALWLERYGAARSAELRAKVAADRRAERNRVTYSELDAED